MKRIIIHWTAGNYYPTEYEKLHYHFLVDKDGKVYTGTYKPEDNEICRPNKYAMHTGGGNTGSVGIAMCAMAGFKTKNIIGNFPITKKQFESCMDLCAKLCKKYKIIVSPKTVLTHYEFGLNHPKTSSAEKIDIIYLPPYSWVSKEEIGSFIRTKVKWYLNKVRE